MRRLTWLLTMTVVATLLVATPSASSARSTATYDVWQWNVAGDTMHDGSVTTGMVDAAAASITRRGIEFAALNELCWQQYLALKAQLRDAGWPQDATNFSRFAAQRSGSRSICRGEAFGVALFSTAPLGPARRWTLPSDRSPAQRQLLCAGPLDQPLVRYCTTHITTSGSRAAENGLPHNVNQLDFVLRRLEAYRAAGNTVVITGDFNAQPGYRRLDNWYSSSLDVPANRHNTGRYRELDDDDSTCLAYGEWTAVGRPGAVPPCAPSGGSCTASASDGCGKIDLIFVRQDRIAGAYSADALEISTSCSGIRAPGGGLSDRVLLRPPHRDRAGDRPDRLGPDAHQPFAAPAARSARSRDDDTIATKWPATASSEAGISTMSRARVPVRSPVTRSTTAATRTSRLSSIEW